jgi:hypothetical protein
MLENLCPNIGKPQIACRPFEEAHAELILQLSNAATDGGERYLEAPRRFRETLRLNDFGEYRQRVQIGHFLPSFDLNIFVRTSFSHV